MSYEEDERNYETPSMVTHVDPYVYATLQSVQGKDVVIETVRGSVRGRVKNVKIDHVVIAAKGSTFLFEFSKLCGLCPNK
ncbi:hypothetical protein BMWSH_3152 [Priestia megaterium WSH-002]|uniref:DUF2642 domain-containing protein n=1 Tax=Priestia megaterium (strain WSH-002) TaxID=1006007 RepID=A0A8D3X036_PRIMW|nr:hypothetical protein BMWSH_3152 [Priestia megaterium WSH-002]